MNVGIILDLEEFTWLALVACADRDCEPARRIFAKLEAEMAKWCRCGRRAAPRRGTCDTCDMRERQRKNAIAKRAGKAE